MLYSASRARPTTCYNDLQRCIPVTHRRQSTIMHSAVIAVARTRSRAPQRTTSVGPVGSARRGRRPLPAGTAVSNGPRSRRQATQRVDRRTAGPDHARLEHRSPRSRQRPLTCATTTTAAATSRSTARSTAATTRPARPTTGRAPDWGGQYPDPDPGYDRPPSGGYPPNWPRLLQRRHRQPAQQQMPGRRRRSNRNAANVQQWSCSGGSNQMWDVIDLGRGEFSIISQRSNKALTVGGGSGDGANVEQNRWSGGDNQRWRVERAGDGAYRIVSVSTNSCLDVEGAKRDDGANIQLWGCSGGANQTWLFRKVDHDHTDRSRSLRARAARSRAARDSRFHRLATARCCSKSGPSRSADRTSTSRATRIRGRSTSRSSSAMSSGGTVARLGRGVTGFREGDRVVSETAAEICGTCLLCRTGRYNLCPERKGFGYGVNGAMAQFVRVPARCLHHIPDSLPFDIACLAEPHSVAYQVMCVNSHNRARRFRRRHRARPDRAAVHADGGALRRQPARRRRALVRPAAARGGATAGRDAHRRHRDREPGGDRSRSSARLAPTWSAMHRVRARRSRSRCGWRGPDGQVSKVGWSPDVITTDVNPLVFRNIRLQGSFSHNYPVWERVIQLARSRRDDG